MESFLSRDWPKAFSAKKAAVEDRFFLTTCFDFRVTYGRNGSEMVILFPKEPAVCMLLYWRCYCDLFPLHQRLYWTNCEGC